MTLEEIIEKIRAEEERQNETIEVVGEDFEKEVNEVIKYFKGFDSMKEDSIEKEGFKNLQDIKDEVFSEVGWKGGEINGDEVDAIAERYAKECCKASLEKASVNAEIIESPDSDYCDYIDKESITNHKNIVLL